MIDPASWLGRRVAAEDVCALKQVRRLAALLDRDPARLREGDALPPGWHAVLFTPEPPQSALGPDGHPSGGDGLPPPPLPRRMLGGRRTRFLSPLRIGAAVRRISEVTGFAEKQGRSGRLVLVTLRHTIAHADAPDAAVIEEQDIVYREAASGVPADAAAVPAPPAAAHSRAFTPDPVLLFRYSAVTFNAHRIHYDRPYATGQEGYPDLVVNGGLTALLLLELWTSATGRAPAEMTARNRRPLFCGRSARLCAAPAGDGWALWAEDADGAVALEATVR